MVGRRIKRSVGEKGQVVIPKDIREHLGLKPGSEIVFEVRDKEVVIKPSIDPIKFVEEFCNIPKKLKKNQHKKTEKNPRRGI